MIAYKCLQCGCIHGWVEHPLIVKITNHIRYIGEDVWYCPSCKKEHRTTDGTLWGQTRKEWKELTEEDIRHDRELLDYYAELFNMGYFPPK